MSELQTGHETALIVVPSIYKYIVVTYNCQLELYEGPTTLRTLLCEADFLISFTYMLTDRQATDHPRFTKAATRLFFSIAISKQLDAACYLGGVHGISLACNFTCALVSFPDQ